MYKQLVVLVLLFAFVLALPIVAVADEAYVPGVKIILEVRSPQGDLRSFHRPGVPPTYWAQDMPVVKGDEVTITPIVATGGAELRQIKIRLDHKEIAAKTEEPWRVSVSTEDMVEGYHFVEVWADTKPPKVKENSATTTFLVVPQNDPLLDVLKHGTGLGQMGPEVSTEERLACALLSRDESVTASINEASTAVVDKPTLFYVSSTPEVKEFFYTLTRNGLVTYTSPRLPIATNILLQPLNEEGAGEVPGEVILTVRAGDGEGRFGAPVWVTLEIVKPAETAEVVR